jgi:hypothetical protein
MVAPASYGWSTILNEAVPQDGNVEMQAPGLSGACDENSVELAVDGDVISSEDFDASFQIPDQKILISNLGPESWNAQSNVYLSCRRKSAAGALGGGADNLEQRLALLENQVNDHETRLDTLEAASGTAPPTEGTDTRQGRKSHG